MYLLQSLQGHSCGRQFFIPGLNESRESEFFRSTGSISHILGPRKLSDSESYELCYLPLMQIQDDDVDHNLKNIVSGKDFIHNLRCHPRVYFKHFNS